MVAGGGFDFSAQLGLYAYGYVFSGEFFDYLLVFPVDHRHIKLLELFEHGFAVWVIIEWVYVMANLWTVSLNLV